MFGCKCSVGSDAAQTTSNTNRVSALLIIPNHHSLHIKYNFVLVFARLITDFLTLSDCREKILTQKIKIPSVTAA